MGFCEFMKRALLLGLSAVASIVFFNFSSSAQEFRLTTTKTNLVASKATIEVPALSGNPDAIIVATAVGESLTQNPHPIGAWYYSGKWSIFNTDHANMAEGLVYKVEYFLRRDANHFVHVMTKANITGSGSVIDNPALNGNANAHFKIFQNHAPDNRTGSLNKYAAVAEYDAAARKWYIKNVNGERLFPDTAYNIVVTSVANPTLPTATPYVPVIAATAAVSPLTVILRKAWIIPNLTTSMLLNGGSCAQYDITDAAVLDTDSAIVTGIVGQHLLLRLSATVSNGSVRIGLCSGQSTLSSMDIRDVRANILVVR